MGIARSRLAAGFVFSKSADKERHNMQKEYKGVNGKLIITDTGITIKRGGNIFASSSQKGDKTIPYSMLSAVQLQKGGLIQRQGYIRFSFMGGSEAKGATRYSVAKDENSILFATKRNKEFEEAKRIIESNIGKASQAMPVASTSNLDELDKLAKLKEQGVLTDSEFEAKKKQLLGL